MRDWNSLIQDRHEQPKNVPCRVGFGILDISRDIDSVKVRKRSFDMTFWMINQCLKNNIYGSYRGFSEKVEEILEDSLKNGDDICIIQAQGMMSIRLFYIVKKSVEYFLEFPDRFVIAHIMNREGRYPGLHRQMLIVNLKVWEQLKKPPFLETGIFWDRKPLYINYIVSENKISADYTPSWIGPAAGEQIVKYTEDGSNWIDLALRNNIIIDNLSIEMRECKCFLYPYNDTAQLEKVWNNFQPDEIDKLKNYSARAWFRKISYQEFIEKDRVYAFNTEHLSAEGVRSPGPIDALFSAAAGFKPLAILRNNGFHKNTVINYFDWCESSLKFKKHLLETWDGRNFDEWLLKHDLEYNYSSAYRGNFSKLWKMELDLEFENSDKFKILWDRYKKLNHRFHVIDIVNEPTKLFEIINQYKGNRVLWTTNIWASMQLHWNIEIEELSSKWNKFENQIPADLILYGQDYMARDMRERLRYGKAAIHPTYRTKNKYILMSHN
jgi:hypothetical protein